MSKVSIIIPVYNSFKLMKNCLAALEKQTYKDFEVIIIDDCSTDNTFDELKKYAQDSELIFKLYRLNQNGGPGIARNYGILKSTGSWLCFCDSDDWYEYNFLELVMQSAKQKKSDIVMADYYNVSQKGIKKKNGYTDKLINCSNKRSILAYSKPSLCNMIFKKDLFVDINIPSLYNGEDVAIIPILISKADMISIINLPLYNYFSRENSTSNQISPEVYKSLLKAFTIIKKELVVQYSEEVEFIGIEVVLYGVILTALKANINKKIILDIIDNFTLEFPEWKKNQYFRDYSKIKKIFIWLAVKKLLFVNNAYVYIHKRIY